VTVRGALPWVAGGLAAATALCIALVDQPVARAIAGAERAVDPAPAITALETATGFPISRWFAGVVLVAIAAIVHIVPRWRSHSRVWLFVAASHLITRFLMGTAKTAFGRLRPREWLESGGGATFFEGGGGFPSGHVVHFGTLALALVIVRPRWWPVLAIPAFVGVARVVSNDHFASDVLGGAAFTVLFTWAFARGLGVGAPSAPR
jgi:membrane-associated phospholipid phosphatase